MKEISILCRTCMRGTRDTNDDEACNDCSVADRVEYDTGAECADGVHRPGGAYGVDAGHGDESPTDHRTRVGLGQGHVAEWCSAPDTVSRLRHRVVLHTWSSSSKQ